MNETLKRAISGAVYIVLLLTSILFSTESFIALFGIFLIIAAYEFSNLVNISKMVSMLSSFLLYSTIILISFYKIETQNFINAYLADNIEIIVNTIYLYHFLLLVTLLISVKCIVFLFDNTKDINPISKYLYLLGYIVLPFIFIIKISFGVKDYNPKIIIGLFILIWTNDTFAYIVGKSIGKRKLFERISPKKTIEGFLGGMLFAAFAGFLISKLYIRPNPDFSHKSILIWTIIALIVSIFGTIGDLIESKFKRIAGVKDSGAIMPGHGGVLDRLDSVIFVAPFIFLFYQILYYVS